MIHVRCILLSFPIQRTFVKVSITPKFGVRFTLECFKCSVWNLLGPHRTMSHAGRSVAFFHLLFIWTKQRSHLDTVVYCVTGAFCRTMLANNFVITLHLTIAIREKPIKNDCFVRTHITIIFLVMLHSEFVLILCKVIARTSWMKITYSSSLIYSFNFQMRATCWKKFRAANPQPVYINLERLSNETYSLIFSEFY